MMKKILLVACISAALVGCKQKGKDKDCKAEIAKATQGAAAAKKCPPQRPCPKVKKAAVPKKPKGKAKGADVAFRTQLSSMLARYGRDNKHPGALALAARLVQDVKPKDAPKLKIKGDEDGKKNAPKAKKTGLPKDSAGLLAMAKTMAGKDKKQAAAIDSMMKMGARSRNTDSPGCVDRRIDGHTTHTYRPLKVYGGTLTIMMLRGDGDTDLDFWIYDENGNLKFSDLDSSDVMAVRWVAPYTQKIILKVRNRGSLYNNYRYCTN